MTALTFDQVLGKLPSRITRVHSKRLDTTEPFIELARRFASLEGTVALISGGQLDCARFHVLGIMPWLTLSSRGAELHVTSSRVAATVSVEPFDAVQALLRRFCLAENFGHLPLGAGLLGYFAYDLKDRLEELPSSSRDDLCLPDLYLAAPSALIVEDRYEGTRALLVPQLDDEAADVERRFQAVERALSAPVDLRCNQAKPGAGQASDSPPTEFVSDFSRENYLAAVEAVQDYIVRGHVYQVNLSQRYSGAFDDDPYSLFVRLFEKNPAPFFAYVHAGDHHIVSTSPERFLLLRKDEVETRPIKGTRPRGKTTEEDLRLKLDLQNSPKDDAELSMIVDLLRNDIGKVCRVDTVRVEEHKRVEAYENVYHLVSIVRGTLDEGKDAVDLLRATFPGGSITGCPKIRSMEIIDELEPVRRHVYTGSIGYLGFDGNMDLSIAIRTATITRGKLVFSVGGGIVFDSKPADEFEETLHKGRTLIDACGKYS